MMMLMTSVHHAGGRDEFLGLDIHIPAPAVSVPVAGFDSVNARAQGSL